MDFTEIALYDNVMSWESAAKGLGRDKMGEMLQAAEDIKAGRLSEHTERRSMAVNYDILIRRYQFSRFSLTVRADLHS